MPAGPKTSDEDVVSAAKRIVERHGLDALSMQAVAEAVDVRAPSLYKRFADREALVRSVRAVAFNDLRATLERVNRTGTQIERLRAMAEAYRAFARRHPRLYAAMFAPTPNALGLQELELRARAAEPLLRAVSELVAPAAVLPAARTVTSFVHGFVSMELARVFRLGGDVDEAYQFGVETLLHALHRAPA